MGKYSGACNYTDYTCPDEKHIMITTYGALKRNFYPEKTKQSLCIGPTVI